MIILSICMKYFKNLSVVLGIIVCAALSGCSKTESYSDLLKEEGKAANWYLAQQNIEVVVPSDGKFKTGSNAPFYKMDDDGYLYMQVVSKGDDEKVKAGDKVYFRFMRKNLKLLYQGYDAGWEGNADDLSTSLGSTYFIYDNYRLENTSKYGTGIQLPLKYLGYNSEVNLILRSYYGFATDQTQCIPYIINVKYYKPEY